METDPTIWLGKRVRILESEDIIGTVRSITIYADHTWQMEVAWWSDGERKYATVYEKEVELV